MRPPSIRSGLAGNLKPLAFKIEIVGNALPNLRPFYSIGFSFESLVRLGSVFGSSVTLLFCHTVVIRLLKFALFHRTSETLGHW